jgi:hypothetical protein
VGHVARIGDKRNAYRLSVGKPERKRPLGRNFVISYYKNMKGWDYGEKHSKSLGFRTLPIVWKSKY